jgi:uncharacterized membrane protein YdbT with pleckstrin-like domain
MNTGEVVLTNDTYYNLGSKTFWYFFSEKCITGFVFLVIALILSIVRSHIGTNPDLASFVRIGSWLSFAIAAVSFLIAFVSSKLIYKNTGFILGEDALFLKHGVLKKEQFAIPYRQIQNIEIERTLGNQMMGISSFIILTASNESDEDRRADPEGILPAIDKDLASALEKELLKRANIQKVISVK